MKKEGGMWEQAKAGNRKQAGKLMAVFLAALLLFSLLLVLIGYYVTSKGLPGGLDTAKSGMLLFGAIFLFITAGMILMGGKRSLDDEKKNTSGNKMATTGMKIFVFLCACACLLFAAVYDLLILAILS